MIKFGEFLENFAKVAKTLIEKYETEYKDLSGSEKKERVDDVITKYVNGVIDNIGLNFVFKFVLRNLLNRYISDITQIIFNLIQTKIEGITE